MYGSRTAARPYNVRKFLPILPCDVAVYSTR
jgi:hypothetical protein